MRAEAKGDLPSLSLHGAGQQAVRRLGRELAAVRSGATVKAKANDFTGQKLAGQPAKSGGFGFAS